MDRAIRLIKIGVLAMTLGISRAADESSLRLSLTKAATVDSAEVYAELGTSTTGLSEQEAQNRKIQYGPNILGTHSTGRLLVLEHQLRSPLLALLLAAAIASFFVGERSDAIIICAIVALSVGLGYVNEYRAATAAESLHAQIEHSTTVIRSGTVAEIPVADVVPGDLVRLRLGDIVPADLRLVSSDALECDESLLTGESLPAVKDERALSAVNALADLDNCALMGTVVHAGSGTGVVVGTGTGTEFGRIAAGLSTAQPETEFQAGLRRFSMLLVEVAAVLTTGIFLVNVVLHRPVLDALLFSLAIAVGITPQLLPAVVSTSLAAGSGEMGRRKVLVKRLVCIEDLGDIDVLFTDKTGTLTQGSINFMRAVPAPEDESADVVRLGLLACDVAAGGERAISGDALDMALWNSPAAGRVDSGACERLGRLPFDHERRMSSVVVKNADGHRSLVVKGAPEAVYNRCFDVPAAMVKALAAEFGAGNRVVAVASRPVAGMVTPAPADECGLTLHGLLVFLDPPKPDAAKSLKRLTDLGVAVHVITGDNPAVALKVCTDLGLPADVALTGPDIDRLDDEHLADAIRTTAVFARVSPEQKARIVRVQRRASGDVAFLGDGVNDALALHEADVGISVDSATDVAKDAADVILLEKDLGVLADGVTEGRRIFANTIKYVLMGTSSNFGNMFSAAGASLFLKFLPMLPSQILLNNLLYDTSQLTIPTDRVDEEQLHRPSHWDIALIRRFMLFFGPISSVFDFVTFAVMLWLFHADAPEFRTGWFVESLATQSLVIFAIRTRRIPFVSSHPSLPIVLSAGGVVLIGALLPLTGASGVLGFTPLPMTFYAALLGMVVSYLVLIECGKALFYRHRPSGTGEPVLRRPGKRHHRRRAAYFRSAGRDTGTGSRSGQPPDVPPLSRSRRP